MPKASTKQISLQKHDFDCAAEYAQLRQEHPSAGAIVMFSGLVRDICSIGGHVSYLDLSTYPALFEAQAEKLADKVIARFDIQALRIIHRFGQLKPTEQIVFVGVAGLHRADAFAAAEMTMDHLKSEVAFWKKETRVNGDEDGERSAWILPRQNDKDSLKRWES